MGETYKEGDVVQLISGGPRMTVESVDKRDGVVGVTTVWFDHNGESVLSARFVVEVLVKCEARS